MTSTVAKWQHRAMRQLLVAIALSLLMPQLAHADEPAAALGRSGMDAALLRYYRQERTTAIIASSVGVVAAGAGGYLLTRRTDFSRGLGIPLLSLGALEGVGAVVYVFQVGSEIDHFEGELARDPAAYRADETAHLHGTTSRFTYYRAGELGLTLAGVAAGAYGFASNRDAWKGAGIGMASLGAPLLVIDTFNNASAGRYLGELERFDPAIGLAPARDGWMLAASGRF